jgi:hypothetical protein
MPSSERRESTHEPAPGKSRLLLLGSHAGRKEVSMEGLLLALALVLAWSSFLVILLQER